MFEFWLPLRFDPDRCLVVCGGARFDPLDGVKDWLRLCPKGREVGGGGDVKFKDFGLSGGAKGAGDGDGEPLAKGLLRLIEPLVVETAMMFKDPRMKSTNNAENASRQRTDIHSKTFISIINIIKRQTFSLSGARSKASLTRYAVGKCARTSVPKWKWMDVNKR